MKLECIGFVETTILWYKSYLKNRIFLVNIESEYSNPGNLNCGIPNAFYICISYLLFISDSDFIPFYVYFILAGMWREACGAQLEPGQLQVPPHRGSGSGSARASMHGTRSSCTSGTRSTT